jgi:hypothetical protein
VAHIVVAADINDHYLFMFDRGVVHNHSSVKHKTVMVNNIGSHKNMTHSSVKHKSVMVNNIANHNNMNHSSVKHKTVMG